MNLSDEIKIQIDGLVKAKMIEELGHVRIVVERTNNLLSDLKIQLSEMKERVKNLGLVVMELQEKKETMPYADESATDTDVSTVGGIQSDRD